MKGKQSGKMLALVGSVSLVLLIVMIAFMAACAKPAPSSTPVTAPTSTPVTAPTSTPVKPITLVFTSGESSTGRWATDFFNPWFADLEKRTGGRVKVELHYGGELASVADAYQATVKGSVNMAHLITGMVPGKFPMSDIVAFASYDTVCYRSSRVWWELYQEFPEMRAEFKDVKLLWVGTQFYQGIGCVIPIRKFEDNKGLKMIASSKWSGARGQALGWAPVSIAPQDMFMSLQTKVVQGITVSPMSLLDLKLGEVLPYVTNIEQSKASNCCVMNLNTWNSLPADIQKIMDDMTPDLVDLKDKIEQQYAKDIIPACAQKYGTEFINLSPEEVARWVAVDRPVFQSYANELEAKGLPGNKLMNEFLRLEKKYSAAEYAFK